MPSQTAEELDEDPNVSHWAESIGVLDYQLRRPMKMIREDQYAHGTARNCFCTDRQR